MENITKLSLNNTKLFSTLFRKNGVEKRLDLSTEQIKKKLKS